MAEPAGGIGGGKVGPFPMWVWIVGVGGVALWFWHSRQAGAQNQAPNPIGGVVTDANGNPIDAFSGLGLMGAQPTSVTQTLDQWEAGAFAALTALGTAPALAQKALYDFTQGNPLDTGEAKAINDALGKVGPPPVNLPFLGTVPHAPSPPGNPAHVKFTPAQFKTLKLTRSQRAMWMKITTPHGAHLFVPKGTFLGPGTKKGFV